MRVKGWLVIALAVTTAGCGTGILAQAMTDRYEKQVTKSVSSGNANRATDSTTETKKDMENDAEKAGDNANAVAENAESCSFPIKKEFSDRFTVKQTKADMPMEAAVNAAVKAAGEIFGSFTIEEAANVDLCAPEVWQDSGKGEEDERYYRAYCGNIMCKEGYALYFEIDSINGQIYRMEKVVNQNDEAYEDALLGEKVDAEIEKEKSAYSKIAKAFVGKHLQTGVKIKCKKVSSGSFSFKAGKYKCHRILATAICETPDGAVYWVQIDPTEKEVIAFSAMWSENFFEFD